MTIGMYSLLIVSAKALSLLPPTLPTDGSTPASAQRSVYLIETCWLPRSEWWMRQPLYVGRQSCRVCSSASRTKLAWTVRLARHPTMHHANVSMTNATYTNPTQVAP